MVAPKSNVNLWTTVIIIFTSAFVVFMVLSSLEQYDDEYTVELEKVQKDCRSWFIWQQTYRKCLLKFMEMGSSWNNMHEAIVNCLGKSTFDMMNVKLLYNSDDVKLIIEPYSNNTPCTELTLGVGGDIGAEKQLLQLIPHCELHGADPILQSGKIFNEVGKYYEVAVSDHSGIFNSSVLVDGQYSMKEVPNIEFVEFITQNVTRKTFDYFFWDNEGPEYKLLPMFHRGGAAEANGIVICQISLELHGPLSNYHLNETTYDTILKNLIQFSPFLPIWQQAPQIHVRMFLFNAENEYCVEKFLQPWCHS